MDVRTLQEQVRRLSSIVDGWDSNQKISEIERDLALEKLRALYEAVRFFDAPVTELAEVETPVDIDLGIDFSPGALSLNEDSEPEPEPEIIEQTATTVVTDPELKSESEPEPESSLDSEPEPEEQVPVQKCVTEIELPETDSPAVVAPTLFGIEPSEDTLRHRQKQRVIMSLYHDEPRQLDADASSGSAEQPKNEPIEEQSQAKAAPEVAARGYAAEPADEDPFGESPFEEIILDKPGHSNAAHTHARTHAHAETPGAVLGDVINHDRQTLADTIAPQRDIASDLRRGESVGDLRRAIGLNDRFLLVRDLFDGDGQACDAALEALNACDDFDDCMIYIAENYVWNANSDGAKFLMELIERKFA